jgi:NAD(P)-dependent dehydrogenase (short-subunit alcohol dehydrogenase family)
MNNLEGKVAVIVGGSGQIGSITAIKLAEHKCRVIIITKEITEKLLNVINLLTNNQLKHFFIIADITDSNSLKYAVEQVKIQAGRCDILINSAGITQIIKPLQIELLTDKIFDDIVKTNLRGVFATIRTFLPLMKELNDGIIINISSASGERASDSNLAYSASKAGLNILTKNLSKVLAPNIRILSISPGYLEETTGGIISGSKVKEKKISETPLKRLGTGEDIANTIIACVTHIRFATGSTIVVDGGRTA